MKKAVFPGHELRERREELGMTLAEAHAKVCVRPDYLCALEEGRMEVLPRGCYAKGFIRSYCALLELPVEPFLCAYDEEARRSNTLLARAHLGEPEKRPHRIQDAITWGAISFFLLLCWVTYIVVVNPRAEISEGAVEAGKLEVVVPPSPADPGF